MVNAFPTGKAPVRPYRPRGSGSTVPSWGCAIVALHSPHPLLERRIAARMPFLSHVSRSFILSYPTLETHKSHIFRLTLGRQGRIRVRRGTLSRSVGEVVDIRDATFCIPSSPNTKEHRGARQVGARVESGAEELSRHHRQVPTATERRGPSPFVHYGGHMLEEWVPTEVKVPRRASTNGEKIAPRPNFALLEQTE